MIFRSAIVVSAIAVLMLTAAFLWLRTSLPVHSGVVRLPGLTADVEVIFDTNAVPHIYAGRTPDAYHALGYVHARDRLFQMDFMRRLGAGRVSEVVGQPAVGLDRTMRTLGLYRLAESTYSRLPLNARQVLDAYAAGVNAYLATRAGALPPEFLALGYTPEAWKPSDSLVWGRLMAMRLTGNWRTEALRSALSSRLTPEQISDLWPGDVRGVPPTLASALQGGGFSQLLTALQNEIPPWFRQVSASNSWVLSGHRTSSGKPLLANDPHLGFRAPGLWYLARIKTPELNLTGATVPGVPFHILGQNGRIAWALTTTDSDTQDLFIERWSDNTGTSYDSPDGPLNYRTREEAILVRGKSPVSIMVRESRHGPVISGTYGALRNSVGPKHDIALASVGLRADDMTPFALLKLNRAQNWDDFRDALTYFHAPQQNISYADTDGNIGFYAAGRVPVRRTGKGKTPADGWTGNRDWTGFIPFDELPHAYNPETGAIVNANHRVASDRYKWFLTDTWAAPYRAERILQRLAARKKHTTGNFADIQNDRTSRAATHLLPILLDRLGSLSANRDEIANMLKTWNGEMSRDRAEPLIFTAWLLETGRAVFADELGDLFPRYFALRPQAVSHVLRNRPAWCDDTATPVTESCADTVTRAFEATISRLENKYGSDVRRWRWGTAHKATFSHPLFSRIPVLREFADIRIESDGGAYTVNRAQPRVSHPTDPFASVHGPGYRAIYDLSNPDNSQFATATGQSGNLLSPFYADNTAAWRDGRYINIPQARTHAVKGGLGILKLRPAE